MDNTGRNLLLRNGLLLWLVAAAALFASAQYYRSEATPPAPGAYPPPAPSDSIAMPLPVYPTVPTNYEQLMANELKIPHTTVSAGYMALQAIISFGLIFLPINHYLYLALTIVILSAAYLLFMKKYYHLHAEYLKSIGK